MTRRGFTFVEVLATTLLVALLMLVGLRVIASVGRTRAEIAARAAGPADSGRMADMIRWDLTNARYVKSGENSLALAGYCGLEAADFSPRHRPVHVSYALREAGGRRWLVREQSDLDDTTNRGRWFELICPDVASFTVLRADPPPPGGPTDRPNSGRDGGGQSAALADTSASGAGRPWQGPSVGLVQPRGYMAVPPRVRLVVRPAAASGPRADELIYVW